MVRQGVFRTEDRNAAVRAPDAQRLRRRHARQSASNQQEINETRVHGEDYFTFLAISSVSNRLS